VWRLKTPPPRHNSIKKIRGGKIMAVYKPSNCVPFLSCWDLTQNQYISCEINTSNETVTGYKIKIFDNDNNTIFEGTEFSQIPESVNVDTATQSYVARNTGLNGSTLTLPLIVTKSENRNANTIYYNNGSWYGGTTTTEINDFSNNTANQPYKWQIVLAQGQAVVGGELVQEPDAKYYDMVIDEAKILGSIGNRIQSWLSENIYKDYYIQLYDVVDTAQGQKIWNQLGVRTRISSYDHSYGFIYPQENTLSQELVDEANYFKIFKDTNDPQYVSTARLVNYRLETDINNVELGGNTPLDTGKFGPSGAVDVVTNPYFTQVYNGDVTSEITYNAYFGPGASTNLLAQGTTLLLMYQGGNGTEPTYHPYNGVFAFQSAVFENDKTTITWLRPANFNTYANFLNRLICVQNESKNYSTSATAENLGTINKTELMFYDETAIGLYPVYEGETKTLKVAEVTLVNSEIGKPQDFSGGIISSVKVKTQPAGATLVATYLGSNKYIVKITQGSYSGDVKVDITYMQDYGPVFKNEKGKAYIRPFIGIHAGDKLFYGNKFQNNVTIKSIDNEPNSENKYNPTWYATYDGNEIFSVDDKYSIRSFFKTSDENPFYAKPSPELIIDSKQWESEGDVYKTEEGLKIGTKRYITVSGTFNNRNWVNYQWFLTDLQTGYVQQSEKIYRGSTEYTFYGLENGHYYLIQWVVEDEYGVIWTTPDDGNIFATKVIINATEFPFDVTYECETQSVLINFVRDGVVIPNPSRIEMLYYYVYPVDENGQQIIGQERVPYKVYIDKEETTYGHYMVSGDSIDGESGVVQQLPYTVTYEDGYMTLTDIDEGKELPPEQAALMEYTQTKLGETATERGSISAPTTEDCVFNSEHILAENFCGNIITYNVDVDDVNYQAAHIELTLTAPLPWMQTEDGEYIANDKRNGIVLSVKKKIGNLNAEVANVPLKVYRKNADGEWKKDNENGVWQPDNRIASAFIKGDTPTNPTKVDYLMTTHPYVVDETHNNTQESNWWNINEEGAWNSTGKISLPLSPASAAQKADSQFSIWSDKELKQINQTTVDGKSSDPINVYTGDYNYWHDKDSNGNYNYWHDRNDASAELYRQTLTTKYTGRQNIKKYQMTFSIKFANYNNPNLNSGTAIASNIDARVFIQDAPEETQGGN